MVWHYIKLFEDENTIRIGWSFEQNKSCDGVILYFKNEDSFEVEKMSLGAEEFDAKRAIGKLWKYKDKLYTDRPRTICIG